MKQLISLVLILILTASMAGCSGNSNPGRYVPASPEPETQPRPAPIVVDPEDDICTECIGYGYFVCGNCNGNSDCPDCVDGRREVRDDDIESSKCTSCYGSARCIYCDGSGRRNGRDCNLCKNGVCKACDGTGINPYSKYVENAQRVTKSICSTCSGSGSLCGSCNSGVIPCKSCRGTGKVQKGGTGGSGGGGSIIVPDDSCVYCAGLGVDKCYDCVTGSCIECGGDGRIPHYISGDIKYSDCVYCTGGKCRTCGGRGEADCPYC